MAKWVYSFGAERDRRQRRDEESARRQGRQSGRDGLARPAGAPGLHHHHRSLHLFLRQRQRPIPPSSPRRSTRRSPSVERPDRPRIRRRGQPAARLGALGRARLDARHDGHRPQPRPQRRIGRDAGQDLGRRALRLRQLSPLHPDVFATSCSRSTHHNFEDILEAYKDSKGYALDTDLTADDWRAIIADYKAKVVEATGKPFPQKSARAAVGRDRRGVRLLDEPARDHLPPPQRHSRRLGHRGQRAGDGVRQHGRDLARPASPSPATPRPATTSSTASSSSTPRARTSSPASARRRTSPRRRARPPAPTSPRSRR